MMVLAMLKPLNDGVEGDETYQRRVGCAETSHSLSVFSLLCNSGKQNALLT